MKKQEWISVARTMMVSRALDEVEEKELAPAGKVTYQFSARGHELAQVVLSQYLSHPHDGATVYYRSRPFVLHAGLTPRESLAGSMSKATGRSGGRDIGVVHHMPSRGSVTVLPTSGDVGAQFTPAAGWAQAIEYRRSVLNEKEWDGAIAACLSGDAAVAANGFWSALTIATTLSLPMLFLVEDNGFGISVQGELQTPGANIADNLAAFGNLAIFDGSGSNPEECDSMVAEAVALVRKERRPVLLRLTVPRLCGHSGADNQSYKSPEQLQDEISRDPYTHLKAFLAKKKYLSATQWEALEEEVRQEVRQAVAEAEADPEPEPSTATGRVFAADSPRPQVGGLAAEGVQLPPSTEEAREEGPRMNLIDGVRKTLETELAANNRLLVFGEDVGVKGGVHGATVDLQVKFGAERVFDTSLSEEGIIGRSVGMALAGLMPVPEIQFRKYADPATEQLNDCGTVRWRTNGDFASPMVVRIPVGYGKRTGDPWHSVSGEAVYAHTLGWRLAFPSTTRDAVGLLRTALRGNDPTFFFEHRALLDTSRSRTPYPGDGYAIPFGVARTVTEGDKLTIVSWGEMVHRAVDAAAKAGVQAHILDLRTISPWDREAVIASVKKTHRALVLHEDTFTNGFGAEVASAIADDAFAWLDAPVKRLATADCPIPYNPGLMGYAVPSVDVIASAIQKLVSF